MQYVLQHFVHLAFCTINITLQQAQVAIEAAHRKAIELGLKMNIAVVVAGANLSAFVHMDDAWLDSINIQKTRPIQVLPTSLANSHYSSD